MKPADTIYLISDPVGEGYVWSNDRAPGIDQNPEDAIEYVKAELRPVSFALTAEQVAKASEFMRNHECTLRVDEAGMRQVGAIGGAAEYCFTPTALGVCETVKCACGADMNLTNYDEW
jgi:hypothetical protein